MKTIKYHGTVRYDKTVGKYRIWCDICFDEDHKTTMFSASTKRRAQASATRHIKAAHGVQTPIIRVGGVITSQP